MGVAAKAAVNVIKMAVVKAVATAITTATVHWWYGGGDGGGSNNDGPVR